MAEMKQPFPDTLIPRGMSAAEVDRLLDVQHYFGGKAYIKLAVFRAGSVLVQHKHTFDHLSVLVGGRVELLVDGVRSVLDATHSPVVLTIAAGKHHGVKALTDGFWLCVHGTDITDPTLIDHTLVDPESSESEMSEMSEMVEVLR